jgi:hypothetical protein
MRCFIGATEGCCKSIAKSPNTLVEEAFWRTMDFFHAYLQVAVHTPVDPPASLQLAIISFLDLWYQTAERLESECRIRSDVNPAGVMREQLQRRLLLLACPMLDLIARTKLSPNDGIQKWSDVLTVLDFPRPRHQEIQLLQDGIANTLRVLADCEKCEPHWAAYRVVLANQLPRLRCQGTNRIGGSRKCMQDSDQVCNIELHLLNGSTLVLKGRIENVCAKRFRGFAIETDAVEVDRPFDTDADCYGVLVDREFPCRQAELHDADRTTLGLVRDVVLTCSYVLNDNMHELRFECKLLRAWPLKNITGTGFAILAPEGNELPPTWIDYVNKLQEPGRYRPD